MSRSPTIRQRPLLRRFVLGLWLMGTCCFGAGGVVRADEKSPDAAEFFESRIRPVLVERCYECHSQQSKERHGGLLLDDRESLRAGGDSGPALVPGEPDQSRIIRAVRYTDQSLQMPPDGPLPAEIIADFETWIRSGAPDPRQSSGLTASVAPKTPWSFAPPESVAPPTVASVDRVGNEIDRFLLSRLDDAGLSYAPRADKPTLLRRATFDLTGLPPTPDELAAFLADNSPDAFSKVVDRLLDSPRYGERWARHWLDLVRYSDDVEGAWLYRDWVVRALNSDLPYDSFVRMQIAGDLLPPPNGEEIHADGLIATTMLSLGQWSGLDRKKRLTDIVDDQIDTIGRTFLGLTLACARCHSHKFDPITTADYYGLAGIFFSSRVISDTAYLSHQSVRLRLPLGGRELVQEHAVRTAEAQAKAKLHQAAADRLYQAFAESLLPRTGDYLAAAWRYRQRPANQSGQSLTDFAATVGLHAFALEKFVSLLDQPPPPRLERLARAVPDYDGEPGVMAWMAHAERPWWAANPSDRDVPIETFLLPPRTVSVNPGDVGGAVIWRSPIAGTVRIAGRMSDGDVHDGTGVAWIIDHHSAGGTREVSSGSMPNGSSISLADGSTATRLDAIAVHPGDLIVLAVWLREGDAHYDVTAVDLSITDADSGKNWNLVADVAQDFLDSNPHTDRHGNAAVWEFVDMGGPARRNDLPAAGQRLRDWWQTVKDRPLDEHAAVETSASDLAAALLAGGTRSTVHEELVGTRGPFWVGQRDDAKYLPEAARAELEALKQDADKALAAVPKLEFANAVQEGGLKYSQFPSIQDVPIHVRGSYEQLGECVPRGFPRALADSSSHAIQSGSGRLELAQWLASASNSLTSRVMVNRLWQHHFGEGLVRTPSNFGNLGQSPTHPQLLDWLACRFVESGWSLKNMHRLLLGSQAYQQSSSAAVQAQNIDPEDRLLWQFRRRALSVEELHDGLLAVSGRLDQTTVAGPAEGDHAAPKRMLFLRSLRADRAGFGPAFDAADASIHVERRASSVVAPQALFLLNSSMVIDAARGLAGRPELANLPDADRVGALYRLVFARDATQGELRAAGEYLKQATATAEQPAAAGELTSWEAFAQALLLANEFMFVD